MKISHKNTKILYKKNTNMLQIYALNNVIACKHFTEKQTIKNIIFNMSMRHSYNHFTNEL